MMIRRVVAGLLALCSLMAFAHESMGAPIRLTNSWKIIVGSNIVEQTAARDLTGFLKRRFSIDIHRASSPDSAKILAAHAIIIGTAADNALIAAESKSAPFKLQPHGPESYQFVCRGENLWIVGETPKGAMDGVFRFEDLRTASVGNLDQAEAPAFYYRIGNNRRSQPPPPGWTSEDQGSYYAHHYINVVWGEKMGPPIPYAVRKKWGLGLMIETHIPPWSRGWSYAKHWYADPANAPAKYYQTSTRKRRVVSPFAPQGHELYFKSYQRMFRRHRGITIVYGVFGDYAAIPGRGSVNCTTGKPYRYSQNQTAIKILQIIKEAAGHRHVIVAIWPWHMFWGRDAAVGTFMQKMARKGYGSLYNEHGNDDDWLEKLDNFDSQALRDNAQGKSIYGPDYISLVSASGDCESVSPVLALPLPYVAQYKIWQLYSHGVRNFALWWSGCEGWVYHPNLQVIDRMIWKPTKAGLNDPHPFNPAQGDPVLHKIAVRDFTPALAPAVMRFWGSLDKAVVTTAPLFVPPDQMPPYNQNGLHIYSWYQRMAIFTAFGAYRLPFTPQSLASRGCLKQKDAYQFHKSAARNFGYVASRVLATVSELKPLLSKPVPTKVHWRIESMYRWTRLYGLILHSQYNYIRCIGILHRNRARPLDSAVIRRQFTPVVKDEIANDVRLLKLIRGFPTNFNICGDQQVVWHDQSSRAREVTRLRSKIAAMRFWMAQPDMGPNLALKEPAFSSSVENSKYPPENAFDGNMHTRWSSQYSDHQWIYVHLGKPRRIQTIVIYWNSAYARKFAIQVSNSPGAPDSWRTVYHTSTGTGGVSTIMLPRPVRARYVRMLGLHRGTRWGYSIYEMQIYGLKARP